MLEYRHPNQYFVIFSPENDCCTKLSLTEKKSKKKIVRLRSEENLLKETVA
jgi:hypothetical protein